MNMLASPPESKLIFNNVPNKLSFSKQGDGILNNPQWKIIGAPEQDLGGAKSSSTGTIAPQTDGSCIVNQGATPGLLIVMVSGQNSSGDTVGKQYNLIVNNPWPVMPSPVNVIY